ncbi:MAG TPA: HAD-IC family P-type ATPase, partial [Phenylobacterium sp.]
DATAGFGAGATVAGRRVDVGSDRMMRQLGLDPAIFAHDAEQMGDEAKTPIYAAVDGKLAALLAVADPIKPTTAEALKTLHALGLKIAVITGDNRRTAQAVADRLGLDQVEAEVLPDGKVAAVEALRSRFGPIAFVGDGINDAPALAAADVGIAMGAGTDIAIESADLVLMRDDLRAVATAVSLSRAVMTNIGQNLAWAFGYNVILIPVAAGALYPVFGWLLSPMAAAGAMALSSVSVVTNALRLKSFKTRSLA